MRNLKRALSLVLAAFMLIGMMVVGAGAVSYNDFSDRTEIVNKDAVSMLTTLGVINGKEDGSYDPNGDVRRDEMAKMISVIMNQGADVNEQFANIPNGLTDVTGNWAIGHINYCTSLGIIAGRGDGTFCPADNVTAVEAAKMLLVAAGYDPQIEGFVGADWAIGVSSKASALGVFRNYNKPITDALNRDDAALLIYNALDVEMVQKYEDGYAIQYSDHRTILAAMYGVYKVEGVVVANQWARLEGTESSAALREGRTTLENVVEYSSTTASTTIEEGIRYNEPVTFNVDTTVDMIGKTVTLFIEKTTILSNSKVLGIALKDDINVIYATTATKTTLADYLKGTGVDVDRDTQYYVNYGYMGSGNTANNNSNNGASAAIAAINEHPNRDLGKTNEYFNVNGVSVEVIDNDNDGLAEYVLYLQETLSEVNRYNDKAETITIYMPKRNATTNALTGEAETKSRDFEDVVFVDDVTTDDLILYVEYGGRTYISLADFVTGVMSRVDRSTNNELYITVNGDEYRQSFIPDAASMVDVDLTHFVIDDARSDSMVGFTAEYDFILDSTGEYVVAVRPTEVKENNYALVTGSAWTLNALDRSGQVMILKANGEEGTYTINWNRSASAFADITNINNDDVDANTSNSTKLERYLGTRDVNVAGSTGGTGNTTYNEYNLAVGSVIRYTLDNNDVLTIDWVMQGNTWKESTSLEISETVNTSTTAGVGDNGKILYLGKDDHDDNLQYNVYADYKNGSGTLSVKGVPTGAEGSDDIDRSGMNKNYAIDLNTVAFYYWNDNGTTRYGVATGWDDMSDVDADVDAQVYPALEKAQDRTYKATNLAEVVLFEAPLNNESANYMLVLDANAASRNTWELNVVFEDGTVDTINVSNNDLGNFEPTNPNHFMRAWSYSQSTNGSYRLGSMYYGVETDAAYRGVDQSDYRGRAYLLRTGTIDFDPETSNTNKYISLSGRANIWDVNDVRGKGDTAISGAFSKTWVNAVLILDNGAIRTAWIWDIPGSPDAPETVYGYTDVNEYATGRLLVQHYAERLSAYQVSELIRDYLHESNSHVTDVVYDAGNGTATVSYDNTAITDIYDVLLERVFAYDVRFSNGTNAQLSVSINGVTYRNGDVAYLSEHSPEWVSTSATTPKDNTFTVSPSGVTLGVSVGHGISVDNTNKKINVTPGSQSNGDIIVYFGVVPGEPVVPEAAAGALEQGENVTMGGTIPSFETPVNDPETGTSWDGVFDTTGNNGDLTLDNASFEADFLINGKATVAPGYLTIESGAKLQVSELTLEKGAALYIKGDFACQVLNVKAGTGININDGMHFIFREDLRIDFVNATISNADGTISVAFDTSPGGDIFTEIENKLNAAGFTTVSDPATAADFVWFMNKYGDATAWPNS